MVPFRANIFDMKVESFEDVLIIWFQCTQIMFNYGQLVTIWPKRNLDKSLRLARTCTGTVKLKYLIQ